METSLVVVVVAAAVLWAALRVRGTVRSAARHPHGAQVGAAVCPGCATCSPPPAACDMAASGGVADCPGTKRAGRPGPPR